MVRKLKRKTPSSIEDKIKPISSLSSAITAIFYGRSGTGKTTLASSFPKPILVLDIKERGTDSISDINAVDSVPIENWEDFENIYSFIESNPDKYRTVIIDALHSLQDICTTKVLEEGNKEWGTQPSIKDYGTITNKMKRWLLSYRDLRDLGINVVGIAHDRITDVDEDEDDNEIIPSVSVRLSPGIASFVEGAFNVIGNTFIRTKTLGKGSKKTETIDYCLRVGPNKYYATKIRSPKSSISPSYIVDPDYDKLIRIIKGELKSKVRIPARRRT